MVGAPDFTLIDVLYDVAPAPDANEPAFGALGVVTAELDDFLDELYDGL